jgi:hypothetical protein
VISLVLRIFGTICLLVGLSHVALGLGADDLLGAGLDAATLSNASLDSQNRFYGAAFMLFGGVAFLCAKDLRRHASLFRFAMLVFFIGGLARILSALMLGLPAPAIQFLALTELALPPLLTIWHNAWLRRYDDDTASGDM